MILDRVAKNTGWHMKTNADLNITYPGDKKSDAILNYVFMTVYQV